MESQAYWSAWLFYCYYIAILIAKIFSNLLQESVFLSTFL